MGRVFKRKFLIPACVVFVAPILFAAFSTTVLAGDKETTETSASSPDSSFLSSLMSMLGGVSAEMESATSPFLPPGHGGTPPGQGGTPPGQTTPPGQGGTPPGQAKKGGDPPPGHGGTPPGQGKSDEPTGYDKKDKKN